MIKFSFIRGLILNTEPGHDESSNLREAKGFSGAMLPSRVTQRFQINNVPGNVKKRTVLESFSKHGIILRHVVYIHCFLFD